MGEVIFVAPLQDTYKNDFNGLICFLSYTITNYILFLFVCLMNKKLLDHFENLSDGEQDILLALSMVYAPVGQTHFQDLLRLSNCVSRTVSNIVGKPLREKLLRLELLEITPMGWVSPRTISETLMKKALAKKALFEKLAPVLINDSIRSHHNVLHLHKIKILRIYLYQQKEKEFIKTLHIFIEQYTEYFIETCDRLFFHEFDPLWFSQIAASIRMDVLQSYQLVYRLNLEDCSLQYRLMEECFKETKNHDQFIILDYCKLHLIRGELKGIEALLKDDNSVSGLELMGMLCFLQNRNDESLFFYAAALKQLKKETRKRNIILGDFPGYFYHLALLRDRSLENHNLLKKYLEIALKHKGHNYLQLSSIRLLKGLEIYQAKAKASDNTSFHLFQQVNFSYDLLFQTLLFYWLDEIKIATQKVPGITKELSSYCLQADENNFVWFAAVSSNLLIRISQANSSIKAIAKKYSDSEFNSIIDLLPRVEPWERALDALTQLGHVKTSDGNEIIPQTDFRMIWTVTLSDQQAYLTPREQKLGKNGRWTKGRPVAVKRLYDDLDSFDYLSAHDKRICQQIEKNYEEDYHYRYYRNEVYEFGEQAILKAIGHPNIYWSDVANFEMPINITLSQLQVIVSEKKGKLLIALSPAFSADDTVLAEKSVTGDLNLYLVEPQHHQVAEIIGEKGLLVPKKAKQQVIDSISSIASMLTVQSTIGGQSSHADTVQADSRLHIHLQPIGDGIQIDVYVQPFVDGGPVYKPNAGGTTVLAEIAGKQLQTQRDFALEQNYLQQLIDECPELYHATDAKWLLDDTEMALEALLQLQHLDEFAVLEWPQGKAIKINKETGLSQVQFSVRKEKDWFSVSGQIQINDDHVMEMQNLMDLIAISPGRFLKLDDGQFIALTHELRQRLGDFSGLGEAHGKNMRFHPLAAQALDEITEGMNVKAGKHWQQQLTKLAEMADFVPQLPSTLQGELREYQVEGFQWMARLSHLDAGACLADDMGLGKTIQALALILSRAADGPTLILAPTSVCNNWLEEAHRFAPTLNVSYFGSGPRQQQLNDAGAFDLVVCSYGLLQTEAEKLIKKSWHTIVADEAQAIKNPLTKRSKAAMALQGDFKLITTGTPIENHLGELWSLFHFINPGLLGSLKKFNERYAQKIENQKDHKTQIRLKKLLQPFILRRLKNDVLTELPARTEVTIHVELSDEERALYEALRRNAVQKMAESQEQGAPQGQQHLKVLAEIMKLRQACCHPRLVLKESEISSAKLLAFEELTDELISNRHKALVFSQFVSHLALIKELLDKKGISYQYLDGSTSMSNRKKVVNAFQSGEGDLFLISLKAGGSGLNLTAADFVVHMDPWWNPAVEDQASDRAHRIGQKRPVTIYRMVAKDTIEDKIVALHKHKRDLANSLLEGSDVSGKMSVKDILDLIQEVE